MGQKGHITGMAGEFFVVEKLFRLEHEATLTLGNAKSIDIFSKSPSGKLWEVSVKAIRGGGKWGIGNENYGGRAGLVFVLLYYKKFSDLSASPDVWVIPAVQAERMKRQWHKQYAIFYYRKYRDELVQFKDAWEYLT